MARILLLGLDEDGDSSKYGTLRSALQYLGHSVICSEAIVLTAIDVVFCNGDHPEYRSILRSLQAHRPSLPVIVVTMLSDSRKWLDALEAGAADYCSSPFHLNQISWILSGLRRPPYGIDTRLLHCKAA